jgi:hypothetical protein
MVATASAPASRAAAWRPSTRRPTSGSTAWWRSRSCTRAWATTTTTSRSASCARPSGCAALAPQRGQRLRPGHRRHDVFLVMEYVPGHTLRDVIRKEPPDPPGKALALLEPVLSALAAAHRAGPDPPRHQARERPHRRRRAASRSPTSAWPRRSAPTPSTPPPAASSSARSPTSRPSWSSTAAPTRAPTSTPRAWSSTSCSPASKPHEGESPIQVAYKHVHEDVPAPSELVPGLPAYVDALVARATARDRGLRPADAPSCCASSPVRNAVDAGVLEDPELYADLALPVAASARGGSASPATPRPPTSSASPQARRRRRSRPPGWSSTVASAPTARPSPRDGC